MITLTASALRRGRNCRRKLAQAIQTQETPQAAVAMEDWRTLADVYRSDSAVQESGPVDADWDPEATAAAVRRGHGVDRARFILRVPDVAAQIIQDVDRLTPGSAGYDVVLVRPVVRLRGEIHTEGALALRAVRELGASVESVTAVLANRNYVREAGIDRASLLRHEDVTRQVRGQMKQVDAVIERLALLQPDAPVPSDYRCEDDHCELCAGTKASLPTDHVRHLLHGAEMARKLTEAGVERMGDIPEDFSLGTGQAQQVAACISNLVHIQTDKITDHLARLQYPLGFLDFEAVSRIVPRWPGVRVGQHVPFLYSLHVAAEPHGKLSHSWAGEGDRDPRAFAAALLSDLEATRSVAAFGAAFERRMLLFLAERAPEYADRLIEIGESLVDMAKPFQRLWVYHPEQRGSLSLKRVAFALAGVTYSDLALRDGGDANSLYARAQDADAVSPELMEHLVEYCARDTEALAEVVFSLHDLVRGAV